MISNRLPEALWRRRDRWHHVFATIVLCDKTNEDLYSFVGSINILFDHHFSVHVYPIHSSREKLILFHSTILICMFCVMCTTEGLLTHFAIWFIIIRAMKLTGQKMKIALQTRKKEEKIIYYREHHKHQFDIAFVKFMTFFRATSFACQAARRPFCKNILLTAITVSEYSSVYEKIKRNK